MNRLFDVRKLEIVGFDSELVQMATYLIQHLNKEWDPIIIADLVTNDVLHGEHRAFAVLCEMLHFDRRVCKPEQSAKTGCQTTIGNISSNPRIVIMMQDLTILNPQNQVLGTFL